MVQEHLKEEEKEELKEIAELISGFPPDIQNRVYGVVIGIGMKMESSEAEKKQ